MSVIENTVESMVVSDSMYGIPILTHTPPLGQWLLDTWEPLLYGSMGKNFFYKRVNE